MRGVTTTTSTAGFWRICPIGVAVRSTWAADEVAWYEPWLLIFEHVVGADADADMRRIAEATSGDVDNVSITDRQLDSWAGDSIDLVTMVAVLHHLDIDDALRHVRRILAPGGRALIVGLAPPRSVRDLLWDSVSIVTNPLIGFIHRPWPSPVTAPPPPFPVKDPVLSFDEIDHMVERRLPGAVMRHRIGFRHTIEWTKPRSSS
ncbi:MULTISPECIES: class I SAM-dependent methyltransferase [unclassified Rhodococcus (in: high G+C Gram-positive bacteria)]|uniref:class I SAM-dependent methyltransferase n=1 Tax=unclassified Rhodococcus (in: high G+C Gram-positive bacteria) TaxID=192944 RepID=UPI00211AAB57|nr:MULTISPECIES: class I SAM-dependent methyltransferase [unclassified Rhodococcus (in: high G+C Gram-positive bacteria)]